MQQGAKGLWEALFVFSYMDLFSKNINFVIDVYYNAERVGKCKSRFSYVWLMICVFFCYKFGQLLWCLNLIIVQRYDKHVGADNPPLKENNAIQILTKASSKRKDIALQRPQNAHLALGGQSIAHKKQYIKHEGDDHWQGDWAQSILWEEAGWSEENILEIDERNAGWLIKAV